MNLFEIDDAIQRCVKLENSDNYVDTETGEIIDTAAIEQLEMDRDTKIRNIACWIKNLEADEKALGDQIKTFTARKNAAKNKRESLKSYLAAFLNGKKWQNSEVAISWRKSESVEVEDGAAIPEQYLRYKEPEINKAQLKADLKAGTVVYGCQLVTKNNIQVK
jgi:hypothetical protein